MHRSFSSSSPFASRWRLLPHLVAVLLFGAASLFPSSVARGATDGGLVVDTTVDADGDGAFSDLEEVRSASAPVTFRVVLTNTLDLDLAVSSLTNAMGATTQDLLAAGPCPDMAGTFVPDTPRTCTFTVDRYLHTYASQPRSELTNLVTATATVPDADPLVASDGATVVNPNADRVSAAVDLTNDAGGDGSYTDDEQATGPGTTVPFRVVVQNTSPGAVVVAELWSTWPGADGPTDLFDHCPDLDQMRLWGVGGGGDDGGHDDGHDDDHGEKPTSATCTWTLTDHAPAAGTDRTDTVTVTLAKRHSPDRRASASDDTTVRTAATEPTPSPAPGDPTSETPTEVPTGTDPTNPASPAPGVPTVDDSTVGAPAVEDTTAGLDVAAREELAATGPAPGLLLGALASLLLGALALRGGRPRPTPTDGPGATGPMDSVPSDGRGGHSDT